MGTAPAADSLAGRVDVWLLAEEDVERFAEATGGWGILTPQERERHDRILLPAARLRFLGARLLSRQVLSLYSGVPPARWRFRTGTYGRPAIDGATGGLDFNITHTRGLIAAIVVRDGIAGIDAEPTPASPEVVQLARKVLTPLEHDLLHAVREDQRGHAFAEAWVVKEAYTKATGIGLCRGFDAFSVHHLRDGTLTVVDDEVPVGDRSRWQIEVRQVWHRYAVGIAVRRPGTGPDRLPVLVRSAMAELATAHGGR